MSDDPSSNAVVGSNHRQTTYSASEAAAVWPGGAVTSEYVTVLCRRGVFGNDAYQVGGRREWRIKKEAVHAYTPTEKRGRPRKGWAS